MVVAESAPIDTTDTTVLLLEALIDLLDDAGDLLAHAAVDLRDRQPDVPEARAASDPRLS